MLQTPSRRGLLLALAGTVVNAAGSAAQDGALAAPTGPILLTVSGNIQVHNRDATAVFDRAMLEALGLIAFTTHTPWYEGQVTFEGVPMMRLLERLGARGTSVTAKALNDYATEIPIDDFARFGTILAMKRNGANMPVRDKGPLFIVYPYDSAPELNARLYYSRSAWQVAQLIVR